MKQKKPELLLNWATHESSKYACEKWHYSKCIPVGKTVKIGVWEGGIFIGCIIYSRGANKSLLSPFGLDMQEGCELTRIALNKHINPVSKMLALSLKFIKKKFPEFKLIVSFADQEQGHHGGIYQATNWIYCGQTKGADEYIYKGKRWHGRAFRKTHGSHLKYIDKGLRIVKGSSKHRYLMPLTKEIKNKIVKLSKKYPKRVKHLVDAPDYQSGEGSSSLTDTLHLKKQDTLIDKEIIRNTINKRGFNG